MKKKLIPALFLLLTPSCVFVVAETDECAHCASKHHEVEHEHDQDND